MARWRSGLTLQFAKLSFAGSNPARASLYFLIFANFLNKAVDKLCFRCIKYLLKSKVL